MNNGILKADTKTIFINKSKYGLTNNIMLDSVIQRVNERKYDINIVEDEKSYKLIISLKIGRA